MIVNDVRKCPEIDESSFIPEIQNDCWIGGFNGLLKHQERL